MTGEEGLCWEHRWNCKNQRKRNMRKGERERRKNLGEKFQLEGMCWSFLWFVVAKVSHCQHMLHNTCQLCSSLAPAVVPVPFCSLFFPFPSSFSLLSHYLQQFYQFLASNNLVTRVRENSHILHNTTLPSSSLFCSHPYLLFSCAHVK